MGWHSLWRLVDGVGPEGGPGGPPIGRVQASPDGGADFLKRVQDSFEAFTARQPGTAILLVAVLVSLISLCLLYLLLQPAVARRRQIREWYARLAAAHGLGDEHLRALERMSAQARLEHPSFLFVRRGLFERHSRELSPGMADDLRKRLFG